jgi:hypothetical protein
MWESFRRAGLSVAAVVSALGTAIIAPAPASAQGTLYLTETFTGATAEPGFIAYGTACLTGAPPAPQPSTGAHLLGGCPGVGTGPVPPLSAAPHGYLQLTDAGQDKAGAVLFNVRIPATQGLSVTFEQWQYGTTTPTPAPADGIAFFLVDGTAAELTEPGAFGGSLGYAQKLLDDIATNPFLPGVDNGYLGIGLDALGNYFGDWERRGYGCPAGQRSPAGTGFRVPEPNKITVRGPGNGTEGYCFLTSTAANLDSTVGPWPSTLPVPLRGDTTSVPTDPVAAEAALAPSRRTVEITISPAPDPIVTVFITSTDGVRRQVLQFPAPQPVPEYYKFGYSASTGEFTDIHLIRHVVIESIDPAALLTLTKTVEAPGPFQVGDRVPFSYQVTNTGRAPVTGLTVTDDKIALITCDASTLAPVIQAPANQTTCRGTYEVTPADLAAGRVVNVALATGNDGGVLSEPAQAAIDIVAAPPTSVAPEEPVLFAGTDELAATGPSPRTPWLVLAATVSILLGTAAIGLAGRRRARPDERP